MTGEVFLDTNVLVYAYDRSEPGKQQRSLDVLNALASARSGVVSTQVLGEFFVTLTGELKAAFSPPQASDRVTYHAEIWKVIPVSNFIVLEAVRGVREHRLNYWDAQIWATALLNQVPVVFSEDFSDGMLLEGIRFVNPFAPAFRIADWA